jgi:hypothetical protein
MNFSRRFASASLRLFATSLTRTAVTVPTTKRFSSSQSSFSMTKASPLYSSSSSWSIASARCFASSSSSASSSARAREEEEEEEDDDDEVEEEEEEGEEEEAEGEEVDDDEELDENDDGVPKSRAEKTTNVPSERWNAVYMFVCVYVYDSCYVVFMWVCVCFAFLVLFCFVESQCVTVRVCCSRRGTSCCLVSASGQVADKDDDD